MTSQRATNIAVYGLGLMVGVIQAMRALEWWLDYQTRRKPWEGAK